MWNLAWVGALGLAGLGRQPVAARNLSRGRKAREDPALGRQRGGDSLVVALMMWMLWPNDLMSVGHGHAHCHSRDYPTITPCARP